MPNWKQELQLEIAGLDDVNRNDAVWNIRVDSGDDFYGDRPRRVIEIQRDLIVKAPRPVNFRIVDGMNFRAGDFFCSVAFLRVKAALEPLPDDPEITVSGESRTLDEIRVCDAGHDFGFAVGGDTLAVGDAVWTITRVTAEKWLDGEPALLNLLLRT